MFIHFEEIIGIFRTRLLKMSSPEEVHTNRRCFMLATRQQLHTLVDMLEENGLDTIYNIMIRFIPEIEPLPDEIESHARAMEEFKRGDVVSHDEIDWS